MEADFGHDDHYAISNDIHAGGLQRRQYDRADACRSLLQDL